MPLSARKRGVEHADVEGVGIGGRIVENKVLGDSWRGETLAVDGDLKVGKDVRLRPPAAELADVWRPWNGPRDHGGGVVVSRKDEHWDPRQLEAAHGPRKVQAGAHVPPIPVEEIAGDYNKIDLLVDGVLDEIVEGRSRSAPDLFDRQTLVARQAMQRTVEMDVSGMQKAEIGQS